MIDELTQKSNPVGLYAADAVPASAADIPIGNSVANANPSAERLIQPDRRRES
ncbi:hypothetical protein [Nocardia vaccinii]|uniref:hypothetical protein n=1 Tax=Nocardia vaccinii TaxID=1822 RepID=UPI001FE10003|nr:hypothetical protein [Nocardia vaccinii]